MANQQILASDGGRITTNSHGVEILTYRAIPHPIAESWQQQLMSVRKNYKTATERVASVIRIEAQIRSLFGVEVSREYRGER